MILSTGVFGMGAVSALVLAGFAVVEGDYGTAGPMILFALGLGWGAHACRQDWRRENQKREAEREP